MAAAVPPRALDTNARATPSHSPTLSSPSLRRRVGFPGKHTRRDKTVAPCLHIKTSLWQQVSAELRLLLDLPAEFVRLRQTMRKPSGVRAIASPVAQLLHRHALFAAGGIFPREPDLGIEHG